MAKVNIYEAKTNLSKIGKILVNKEEEYVIVSNNGKPYLKITLYDKSDKPAIGILKGKYSFSDEPDWFNDDFSELFAGEEVI